MEKNTGIEITKKDVAWNFISRIFSLASGLIALPFILRMLTEEEVGMNYLMLTVSSIVTLVDFGFAPQFARNFSYVYSGAHQLLREGIQQGSNEGINYRLLATLLKTAKKVYRIMALIALAFMLSFGTLYVYKVTDGFINVENSFPIWIVYSLSTFFNVYYAYYTTLLSGSGRVAESAKAGILSRLVNFVLCIAIVRYFFRFYALSKTP